jgi:hypothetical protein
MANLKEIFASNPECEVLYLTSDGLAFLNQASANWHEGRTNGEKITLVYRHQYSEQAPPSGEQSEEAVKLPAPTKAQLAAILKEEYGVEVNVKKLTLVQLEEMLKEFKIKE